MYRKLFLLSMITLSGGVPALAAGHLSVPPASFLNYHVSTLPELSQEVTLDPAVRNRLAHHFHVSDAAMSAYIRRNLLLTHLKSAGYYQVACVRPNGTEYWVRSHLPAGTPIFSSRITGQPILKLACGNPMVSALPPGAPDKDADINGKMTPPQTAETPTQTQMAALVTPGLIPGDAAVNPVMAADNYLALDNAAAGPVVKTAGFLQSFTSPSILSDLGPLALGAGALAALSSSHHGSSFQANASPVSNSPAAVPEASTSLLFGLLLLGGAFFTLRRKRTTNQTD